MNNQQGFVLPLVLFTTAIVFVVLMSQITMYRSEINITKNHLEQVKIESLFQMGREKVKDELRMATTVEEIPGKVTYQLPLGSVIILISREKDNQYDLVFDIFTSGNQANYGTTNTLFINDGIPAASQ